VAKRVKACLHKTLIAVLGLVPTLVALLHPWVKRFPTIKSLLVDLLVSDQTNWKEAKNLIGKFRKR